MGKAWIYAAPGKQFFPDQNNLDPPASGALKGNRMRNIFLVTKHELLTTIAKRSFWIMTFVFPAFIILLNVGTQVMARSAIDDSDVFVPGEPGDLEDRVIGYVDQSGVIHKIPPEIPEDLLSPYPDAAAAHDSFRKR
jgi:hypothetical protein